MFLYKINRASKIYQAKTIKLEGETDKFTIMVRDFNAVL